MQNNRAPRTNPPGQRGHVLGEVEPCRIVDVSTKKVHPRIKKVHPRSRRFRSLVRVFHVCETRTTDPLPGTPVDGASGPTQSELKQILRPESDADPEATDEVFPLGLGPPGFAVHPSKRHKKLCHNQEVKNDA